MAYASPCRCRHGATLFIEAAQAAGCKTANGGHMVEAVQDLMADFMLGK
jgi:shikimate dehydrogenase